MIIIGVLFLVGADALVLGVISNQIAVAMPGALLATFFGCCLLIGLLLRAATGGSW